MTPTLINLGDLVPGESARLYVQLATRSYLQMTLGSAALSPLPPPPQADHERLYLLHIAGGAMLQPRSLLLSRIMESGNSSPAYLVSGQVGSSSLPHFPTSLLALTMRDGRNQISIMCSEMTVLDANSVRPIAELFARALGRTRLIIAREQPGRFAIHIPGESAAAILIRDKAQLAVPGRSRRITQRDDVLQIGGLKLTVAAATPQTALSDIQLSSLALGQLTHIGQQIRTRIQAADDQAVIKAASALDWLRVVSVEGHIIQLEVTPAARVLRAGEYLAGGALTLIITRADRIEAVILNIRVTIPRQWSEVRPSTPAVSVSEPFVPEPLPFADSPTTPISSTSVMPVAASVPVAHPATIPAKSSVGSVDAVSAVLDGDTVPVAKPVVVPVVASASPSVKIPVNSALPANIPRADIPSTYPVTSPLPSPLPLISLPDRIPDRTSAPVIQRTPVPQITPDPLDFGDNVPSFYQLRPARVQIQRHPAANSSETGTFRYQLRSKQGWLKVRNGTMDLTPNAIHECPVQFANGAPLHGGENYFVDILELVADDNQVLVTLSVRVHLVEQ